MRVNGTDIPLLKQMTLYDYLVQEHYKIELIVVERNGKIIPKDRYKKTILDNEDKLEIVTFVGGG